MGFWDDDEADDATPAAPTTVEQPTTARPVDNSVPSPLPTARCVLRLCTGCEVRLLQHASVHKCEGGDCECIACHDLGVSWPDV